MQRGLNYDNLFIMVGVVASPCPPPLSTQQSLVPDKQQPINGIFFLWVKLIHLEFELFKHFKVYQNKFKNYVPLAIFFPKLKLYI